MRDASTVQPPKPRLINEHRRYLEPGLKEYAVCSRNKSTLSSQTGPMKYALLGRTEMKLSTRGGAWQARISVVLRPAGKGGRDQGQGKWDKIRPFKQEEICPSEPMKNAPLRPVKYALSSRVEYCPSLFLPPPYCPRDNYSAAK